MNTQTNFTLRNRNPDVLSCIANLSNDEIFTPPELANQMLETLARAWADGNNGANIWEDKNVKFLDPCTKSGVFLREITSRLTKGLEKEIPNLEKRVNHILSNQVYGIGITQITSLLARRSVYCSKEANSEHSICKSFKNADGNIWFKSIDHTWDGDKCRYCGAGKSVFDRPKGMETHAYAFIHNTDPKTKLSEIFLKKMQFDVIIGNPPYQLASDGGTRDVPIYQNFVEQAKALQPRFLSMIIPSRWMASGLGLSDFRHAMLSDQRLSEIVDYPSASDVFPGVEVKAGVCYFLWDAQHDGECNVTTIRSGEVVGPVRRKLNEYDVFVRDARAVTILKKILTFNEASINSILARDKEFGWTSNFSGFHEKEKRGDVPLYHILKSKRAISYVESDAITKSEHLVKTWKLLVPKAYGAGDTYPHQILGRPIIAESPSVCTQSYLFFYVDSRKAAESIRSYYLTRFFRFVVSLRKITQDATHSTYTWVPMQDWNRTWTDEILYDKYGITKEDRTYIESQVREMTNEDQDND